jgi:hypothetical protein
MRMEVTQVWRKLHNEELHNSYHSTIINLAIKSRRTRRVGPHGRKETCIQVFAGESSETTWKSYALMGE